MAAKPKSKPRPAPAAADPLDALLASAQRAADELLPPDRAKRLRAWLGALAAGERAAGDGRGDAGQRPANRTAVTTPRRRRGRAAG